MPEVDAITAAALRAGRGDTVAATAFVRATQVDVWRMVAGLSSRAEADDLTQETYARAFTSLHRFHGRSSARTWLLAIARRVCADAVRSAVRQRAQGHTRLDDAEIDHEDLIGDPAEIVAGNALLDLLEPQRREAFVLTQLVGLSYAEAAEVCRCPVGTIRSRVARARGDLVDALDAGNTDRGSASGQA